MTQQPPAADPGRRSSTSRAEDSARRRTIVRRRAAVAVGGVAVVVIAAILLSGGKVPLIGGPDGENGFSFALRKVQATPITRTPPAELHDVARTAGAAVKETLDELYFRAFVDRDSWGNYEAALELFEGRAAARAGSDTEVLTLGSTANDDFGALDGASGTLTISVLTDAEDAPISAVAQVEFEATVGARGGGSSTQVVSIGSFFLREVDGAWRIFAYQVDRDDETVAPSPSGSPS